jgi:hypothetical protein
MIEHARDKGPAGRGFKRRCRWLSPPPGIDPAIDRDTAPPTCLDRCCTLMESENHLATGIIADVPALGLRYTSKATSYLPTMRFSYSNTLGWNTFPVPTLTEKNKADLTRCAEDILLAHEAHFPATIVSLYDPDEMPADLRDAHEKNDEVLDRIYIGRRFRNDSERLGKLFELETKMNAMRAAVPATRRRLGKPERGKLGIHLEVALRVCRSLGLRIQVGRLP